MSEFFLKIPNKDLLLELLEKKDYPSILSYAKPLNPKTPIARLLSVFQTTDKHDNEFCLYMAIMVAKLKSEDLIKTLDEYIADVTTIAERRDLFFWKEKNLGVISDIFEKELNKYLTLLQFLHKNPKDSRSKYFQLKLSSENIRAETSSPAVSDIAAILKKKTEQKTIFAKRILAIGPSDAEAFKFASTVAKELEACQIELRPEFVKQFSSPLVAFRLVCELAQKYRPLLLVYSKFSGIDHENLNALFLEQAGPELLEKNAPQETYFIALSQNPVEIYRETFEDRWFQKAVFLRPSSPDARKNFFRNSSVTKNLNADFLAAQSAFYSEEEITHLINQLAEPQADNIVRILEDSKPRFDQWLLDASFLKTWTYYPIWKEICDYTELENNFKKDSGKKLKEEFIEDFLALAEIEKNPASLLSESLSPFSRFKQCRKDRAIPADIQRRLFALMQTSQQALNQDEAKTVCQKIFQFLVQCTSPAHQPADFVDRLFPFSLIDVESAITLLSVDIEISFEKILQLAEAHPSDSFEGKVIYYLQRHQIRNTDLFVRLAKTFRNQNPQKQVIHMLRDEIDREKRLEDLEKLFSLVMSEFANSGSRTHLWLLAVESFNAANNTQNFSKALNLNSAEIYHQNQQDIFNLIVAVMSDDKLVCEAVASQWLVDMLEESQPSTPGLPAINLFKTQAFRFLQNKKIHESQRVRFLKNILNWDVERNTDLTVWLKELTSEIDFTKVGWSDLKNSRFLRQQAVLPERKAEASAIKTESLPPVHSGLQNVDVQQSLTSARLQLHVEKLKQDIAETMAGTQPLTEKLKRIEELQTAFDKLLKE